MGTIRTHSMLRAIVAATAFGISACTTTTIVEPFYRPGNALVEHSYVSPAANFSSYSKLLADPLEIYYADNAPEPDEADLERLRKVFRDAFLPKLEGYELVTEPGPDVLRVRGQIIDMKLTSSIGTFQPTGRLQDLVTRGQLTFLMEIGDSMSDRVLARAGDTEDGSSTSLSDEEAGWAEVEAAAERWATLFRTWLDANLAASR
ncbi:MAG: DUF3313 family protein [Gammaproteobacteria bacterium]